MTPLDAQLTREHTEVYDRQIRVWGFAAQSTLSSSTLYLYKIDSINFEIAKNCVLSGINLKINDEALVAQEHLSTNLFIKSSDIGESVGNVNKSILSSINILANVQVTNVIEHTNVLCCSTTINESISISVICRNNSIPSYFIFKAGQTILVIADLLKDPHKPLPDLIDSVPKFLAMAKRRYNIKLYSFLAVLYCKKQGQGLDEIPASFIDRKMLLKDSTELWSAFETENIQSSTIAGGIISQDIIKLITNANENMHMVLFDGANSVAYADTINNNVY
jgi:hypothetical protein